MAASESTRNYLFYGLNLARFLSIIGLLLVFSSSVVNVVNNIKAVNAFEALKASGNATEAQAFTLNCDYIQGSTVPNQPAGVFWTVVAGLLIIFQSIVLILSEVGWPVTFFNKYFPVLGSDFGSGALGIFQALIGAQILSHHVDDFTLVSAFFLFAIGCLNMLLGLVFREDLKKKRSIRGHRDEKRNVLPTTATSIVSKPVFVNASPAFATSPAAPAADFGSFRSNSFSSEKSGYGFGRQGEKSAALRGFILQKPEESLPRYTSPSPAPSGSGRSVRSRSPSPSPPPTAPPSFLASPPKTSPLRLQRNRSNKSTTSSFVSPGARRHEQHNRRYLQQQQPHRQVYVEDDDEDDDEDEDDIYDNRTETPPPTFRSSPTAI